MAYLYGELDPESRSKLKAHMGACAECHDNMAAWGGAMEALDAWQFPPSRGHSAARGRLLRWAVAALVLLAVGYGLARSVVPAGPDEAALRESLRASLAPALEAEIRQKLREELDAEWQSALAHTRAQCRRDALELGVQTLAASNALTQRLLGEVVALLHERQVADGQAVVAMLDELELRRLAGEQLLRNDLDDLAVMTGDEILRTRWDLGRLLVQSGVVQIVSDVSRNGQTPQERRGE